MILTIDDKIGRIEFNVLYDKHLSNAEKISRDKNVYFLELNYQTKIVTYALPEIVVEDSDYDDDDNPEGYIVDRFSKIYGTSVVANIELFMQLLNSRYFLDPETYILFNCNRCLTDSLLKIFSEIKEFGILKKALESNSFEEIASLYETDQISEDLVQFLQKQLPHTVCQTTRFELELLADPSLKQSWFEGYLNLPLTEKNVQLVIENYREFFTHSSVEEYFKKLYRNPGTRKIAMKEFINNEDLFLRLLEAF